jgi:hypothetical protein
MIKRGDTYDEMGSDNHSIITCCSGYMAVVSSGLGKGYYTAM